MGKHSLSVRWKSYLYIILSPSSISHPQTSGQVESANKNILQSLKKKLDEAKGLWVEELPSTFWAIKTIVHLGTKDTSFNLAFGLNVVIPIKFGINTF